MAIDGISRLISVTQLKSNNANDEAMAGADKQRGLISETKLLRATQRSLESVVVDRAPMKAGYEIDQVVVEASPFNDLRKSLGEIFKPASPRSEVDRGGELKQKVDQEKRRIDSLTEELDAANERAGFGGFFDGLFGADAGATESKQPDLAKLVTQVASHEETRRSRLWPWLD